MQLLHACNLVSWLSSLKNHFTWQLDLQDSTVLGVKEFQVAKALLEGHQEQLPSGFVKIDEASQLVQSDTMWIIWLVYGMVWLWCISRQLPVSALSPGAVEWTGSIAVGLGAPFWPLHLVWLHRHSFGVGTSWCGGLLVGGAPPRSIARCKGCCST